MGGKNFLEKNILSYKEIVHKREEGRKTGIYYLLLIILNTALSITLIGYYLSINFLTNSVLNVLLGGSVPFLVAIVIYFFVKIFISTLDERIDQECEFVSSLKRSVLSDKLSCYPILFTHFQKILQIRNRITKDEYENFQNLATWFATEQARRVHSQHLENKI